MPGFLRLSTTCFFSFAHSLVLFSSSWFLLYIDFIAFFFSILPTVGCVQHLTPQNTCDAEDQPCCHTCPPLSRSAVLPCPLSLGIRYLHMSEHVTHEFPERACECKLTFLSMRHVRMHVHCENKSLIQSLTLMHSAIMYCQNTCTLHSIVSCQKISSKHFVIEMVAILFCVEDL